MKNKRLLILGAVVIVAIIAVVAIVSPKFFQKNKSATSQTNTNPVYVECPVDQTFCAGSKVVQFPKITGINPTLLGWKVPIHSQVFAVFDGKMKEEIAPISSTSALCVITITSLNGKYQAHYTLVSFKLNKDNNIQTLSERNVKAKEIIIPILADDLGGLFNDQNVNLVFNVSFTNGVPINIQPSSIGKIILP